MVERDTSTANVRFKAENMASASYDTGWLELAARPRRLLVVPTSSVLYSGESAYVLATPSGGHTFTRRSVTIGKLLDSGHVADSAGDHFGTIVVLSGLQEGGALDIVSSLSRLPRSWRWVANEREGHCRATLFLTSRIRRLGS